MDKPRKGNGANFIGAMIHQIIPWQVSERLPPREMLRAWPELVGPYLAKRVKPVCLERDGELVLSVQGSALRQELTLNGSQLLAKLAAFDVSRLKLITARLQRSSAPPSPPLEAEPLSAAQLEEIDAQVANVKNPGLRRALRDLLIRARQNQAGD
jgi:hypothetical protein